MSLAEDLSEHLENTYAEGVHDRDAFVFDTDRKANWGLRMLAKVRQERVEITALADAERERIAEWETARQAALDGDEAFFSGGPADYWRRELEAELAELLARGLDFDAAWAKLEHKSRKLPHGTLRAVKGRASVVVEDAAALVAWAEANRRDDLLLQPPPTPSKAALGDLPRVDGQVLTSDGEVLPGVRVVTPGVRYVAEPLSG